MAARRWPLPLLAHAQAGAQVLAGHRALARFALAFSSAFVWIAIYRYFYAQAHGAGEAFARTAFLYALAQSVTMLLLPFAAARFGSGLRQGMLIGIGSAAMGFFLLAIFGMAPGASFPIVCVLFALCMGAHRAFYRTPYVVTRASVAATGAAALAEALVIFAPLAAGFAVEAGLPLSAALGITGALLVASLASLAFLPPSYERYGWGYRASFMQLFAREHRPLFLRHFYFGIEGTALLLAWPIMIFVIAGRSFAVTGTLLSLSLAAAMVARLIGRRLVRHGWQASVPFLMTLAGSSWVMRLVAATPADVLVIDAYAHAIPAARGVLDRGSFEQHADDATYLDEYTILKEEALAFGRLAAALGVGVLALNGELSFAFVSLFLAAAIAAVLAVPLASRRGRVTF